MTFYLGGIWRFPDPYLRALVTPDVVVGSLAITAIGDAAEDATQVLRRCPWHFVGYDVGRSVLPYVLGTCSVPREGQSPTFDDDTRVIREQHHWTRRLANKGTGSTAN